MKTSNVIVGPDGQPAPKPDAPPYTGLRIDINFLHRVAQRRCAGYKEVMRKILAKVGPICDTTKIGRNEECPCGSLKKFKFCHWKMIEAKKT